MSESTITLPVVVEDRAALAELKKIQKELGNAGQESAKLNKQIEDAMKNMASKTAKAYGDMGVSLQGLKNKWNEFSSVINVANQAFGWAKQAIDLAKYSAEFSRLERAVPVERMRALQAETGGTVSKFELLKRAAKEMGLSATAGLDDASRRMQQTLVTWQNTVNDIKAGLGSIAMTAIDWLDRLSDSIAGVETIRNRRDQARANAKRNIIDRRPQDPGASFTANAVRNFVDEDSPEFLDEVAKQDKWLIRNNVGADAAAPRAILDNALRAQREKPGTWAGLLRPSGSNFPSIGDAYRSVQMWNAEASVNRKPGKRADTAWGFGDLLSPTSHYGADMVGGASDALGSWSQSANGVGGVFSRIGGIGGGLAGAAGGAYEAGAGGMRDGLSDKAAKLKEFTDQLRDQTTAVGAAYSTLSAGIAAGVEAAISGSESVSRAALKAAATQLKAIAIQSTVQAGYSVALGLFGDPTKFAAAAKFAAVAVAAGAGSAMLGSLGGGASAAPAHSAGGSSAANSVPTNSQNASNGPQTIVVNIGAGVLAMDKGQLGETVVKAIDAGKRVGRVRSDRDVSVQYG